MTANVQLSGKTNDGRIFVVGGDTVDDVLVHLTAVLGDRQAAEDAINDVASALAPVSAGGAATSGTASVVALGGSSTYRAAAPASDGTSFRQAETVVRNDFPDAAPVTENPAAPSCVHGVRVFKTGEKNGKRWGGYLCAAGQGATDKCPPQWVK